MFQPGIKRNNNLISLPNDDSKIIVYIYIFLKIYTLQNYKQKSSFLGHTFSKSVVLTSYTLVHPKYLQELHVDNY